MQRMIYTRVVIDMASGEVLEQDGFVYDGPVAECGGNSGSGGGGSTTTNTVDKAYNARMAAIAEEQNTWARDYFNMWQQYYKPYEIAQARSNLEVLPMETDLYKKQLASASELLPGQTQAARQFLTASTQGVDVNERMALATADTANAWKGVGEQTARANARMGVNPNSGRYQGIQAALGTQQAAQLAGARTQARVGAEQENYDRLAKAAGFNASGGILQGIGMLKG